MLRTALALAQRGLAVFPCRERSKLPATEHGFLNASKDAAVIETWWRSNPNYNVAVATGTVSGFFAVDVDDVDAEIELRRLEAANGVLPRTVETITGDGRHIWLAMPNVDLRNSASQLAPGIDIRAAGGYILVPPSVHPTGRRYAWSVDSASSIAAAPAWLVARLVKPKQGSSATPPAEWRELIQGVAEGARDNSVTKLAGYLLRRHVDPFVALALLQSWNASCCSPPLADDDIVRIVNSIAGKEARREAAYGGYG